MNRSAGEHVLNFINYEHPNLDCSEKIDDLLAFLTETITELARRVSQ